MSTAGPPEKIIPGTPWVMARWNRPFARGMAISAAIDPAPADSPNVLRSRRAPTWRRPSELVARAAHGDGISSTRRGPAAGPDSSAAGSGREQA
jgi:hypothetical protein